MRLKILLGIWATLDFAFCQYNVYRQDPFAVLSRTLLTYQQAACDGTVLNLVCPTGTKISIQLVQYGRTAPSSEVCPPTTDYPGEFSDADLKEGKDCTFPEALKTVEEKCHGQEACSMVTAPEVFGGGIPAYAGGDPCPGVRKYVEVAYKCKPTVFKSKVVCQGSNLQLECKDGSDNDTRIAIYSSSFSASGGTHIYCPNQGKSDFASAFEQQACEEQYATEPVMKMCHGQRSCTFLANGTSLGAPDCKAHHNIYLKTVYTCIHQSVLKPQYIDTPSAVLRSTTTTTSTTSSTSTTTTTTTTRSLTEEEKLVKPAETMLDDDMNTMDDQVLIGSDFDFTSQRASQDSEKEASNGDSNFVVGFVGDFFASYHHIKEHKEKFILFVSLTVALGLSVVAALFLWNSYRSKRLDRIAQSMRQPNLSQSTLCSATSSMLPNGQNGRSGGRNSLDNGQIINAFSNSSSPAHSPNCPPGAIDIEVEVGDHEVDTMFRDPGPKPLIVARATPPLQDASGPFLYGTLNRRPPQMSLPRPRSDRLGSADETLHQQVASMDIWTPMSTTASAQPPPIQPPYFNGPASVASSSLRSESPMSPIQKLDHYQLELSMNPRYSTIGRPGRGLGHHHHHHHLHTNSPGRSVMIVAPGDPIPPHLPPQQQLQLQQMSSDFHPNPPRPPSSDCYG